MNDYFAAGALQSDLELVLWLYAEAVHEKGVAYRMLESVNQDAIQAIDDARGQLSQALAEVHRLRREVEFEANGERWSNAIVGRPGHEYVNGYRACNCGAECLTLDDWERHLLSSRVEEGRPLCACVTAEQANQLAEVGWPRPVCTVHPGRGLTTSGAPERGDVTATPAPLSSRPSLSVLPEEKP